MYLKSLQITNFRKFGTTENIIEFVDSKDNLQQDINITLPTTLIVEKTIDWRAHQWHLEQDIKKNEHNNF